MDHIVNGSHISSWEKKETGRKTKTGENDVPTLKLDAGHFLRTLDLTKLVGVNQGFLQAVDEGLFICKLSEPGFWLVLLGRMLLLWFLILNSASLCTSSHCVSAKFIPHPSYIHHKLSPGRREIKSLDHSCPDPGLSKTSHQLMGKLCKPLDDLSLKHSYM